jgi:hypothetical protein
VSNVRLTSRETRRRQPATPPLASIEGPVQEVSEADAGLGEALGHEREMPVQIGGWVAR